MQFDASKAVLPTATKSEEFDAKQAVVPDGEYVHSQAVLPPETTMGNVVASVPRGIQGTMQQMLGGGVRMAGDVVRGITGYGGVAELGAGLAESGTRNIESSVQPNMSFGQEAVYSGLVSTGVSLPAALAYPLTGIPGVLTAIGAGTAGKTYDEARNANLSPARSLVHSAFEGSVEALTELLPAKALFGPSKNILSRFVNFLMREVPGELVATALQDASAKLGYRPNMTADEFLHDMLLTVASVGVSAPVQAGVMHGVGKLVDALPEPFQSPGIPPANPQAVPPAQPGAATPPAMPTPTVVDDPFDLGQVVQPDRSIEAVRAFAEKNPATADDIAKADAVDEGLKAVAAAAKEKGEEPDLVNSEWIAGHMRTKYADANPANTTPPEQHPVLFGPNAGKTLGEIQVQDGEVVVTGYASEKLPLPYLEKVYQSMQDWVRKFAPKAKVVITTRDKFNEYVVAQTVFKDGYAFLSPRHFYQSQLDRMQPSEKYPEGIHEIGSETAAVYSLSHEFGRILTETSLKEAAPEVRNALQATWQSLRQRVESGEMSAQEFLQRWLNPWKLGRGIRGGLPGKELDRFIQQVMYGDDAAQSRDVSKVKAIDFVKKMTDKGDGNIEQVLSFQSYVAEQTARYFHDRKVADQSPLGQFFAGALQRLREFFDYLFSSGQLTYINEISADEAFTKWMDSLAAGQSVVATAVEQKKKEKQSGKKKAKKNETPMEPKQSTVADPTAETKRLRALAIQLKTDSPEQYAMIMNMIKNGEFELAQQELSTWFDEDGKPKFELGGEDDPYDLDFRIRGFSRAEWVGLSEEDTKKPHVIAYVRRLMHEMGGLIYLPTFKTAAGDWEMFRLWQRLQIVRDNAQIARTAARLNPPTSAANLNSAREFDAEAQDIKLEMHRLINRYDGVHASFPPPPELKPIWRKLMDDAVNTLENNARPNVTAVLDANGEPREVYYGSAARDEAMFGKVRFSMAERGARTTAPDAKRGFFFAGDVYTAETYAKLAGDRQREVLNDPNDRLRYENLDKAAKEMWRRSYMAKQKRIVLEAQSANRPVFDVITELQALKKESADFAARAATFENEKKKLVHWESLPEVVYPFYLFIKRPFEWDMRGAGYDEGVFTNVIDRAIASGHDGVMFHNVHDGGPLTTVFVAFDPQQVKSSVGNVGTFGKTDEIHFELGDETEAAEQRLVERMPSETEIDPVEMGEGMKNLSRWQLATLQLQQLAHLNQGVAGLQYLNRINLTYEQLRKTLMAKGQEIAHNWQFLMKEARAHLDRALQAEYDSEQHWTTLQRSEDGNWVHVPSETLRAKLEQMGVDTNSDRGKMIAQLFVDTKNIHLMQLQALEKILYDRLAKRYKDYSVLAVKAQQLFKTVEAIRNVPFLPQSRFGKYSVVISEVQPKGPPKPVHIEYFESKKARDEAYRKLHKSTLASGNKRIKAHDLSDAVSVMPSIPQTYIDTVSEMLGLSKEDTLAIQMAAQAVKGKAVFGKYDKEFRQITGASKDLQRNFADHVWHTANMLAKLKYRPEFNRATTMVSRQIREMHVRNEYTAPLQNLQVWMQKQSDYILNPQSELQKVRSVITLLALWGNVKTAAMNMTSIVNTWSFLIDKFGYKGATEEILRALRDEAQAMYKTDQFSAADKELRNRLNIEGITDQSYAYMLAEMSNSGALRRAFKQTRTGQAWEGFLQVGMLPFRIVEIYSRRAGALAAARLMVKQGASVEAAHDFASRAVLLTQNDFSPGNRPRFMQGKKSVAMIFLSFVQMMMFLMGGGAGAAAAARLWVFYGMLGGMLALPGMENLMDILKLTWRKVLRQDEDPKLELTRFLNEVTGGNAQWLMSGIFHNLGGFDLSRSISLGRLVPGTDVLANEGDLNFKFTNMAADLTGPFGGTVQGVLQFLTSTDPNWLRRAGYALPGTSRSLLQTYLFHTEGVRGGNGAIITRDRDGTIRNLTGYELMGRALGFQPAIVSHNRELDRTQREQQEFWMNRRASLTRLMWEAKVQNDREAIADVRERIREYNAKAPSKELRLSERDLQQSMRQRQLRLQRDEEGRAPLRRYDPLYQEVENALRGGL